MKVVILVAGFGSRLKPLTDNTPKSLLPIGDTTPLANTIEKFLAHNVREFIFITGNFDEQIQNYVARHFPSIKSYFIRKHHYPSNTGYSLMLAAPYIGDEPFIKIDGDLMFEDAILTKLMATPDDANYICLDRQTVDDEVIKAEVDPKGVIVALGKNVETKKAVGESIGLEKICSHSSQILFETLKAHMSDKNNWQEYYEFTYDYLIKKGHIVFKYADVTGLKWVEIDTPNDYQLAKSYFA